MCIEHSRDHKEYYPEEDIAEGEKEERRLDRKFRGRAYALDDVGTQLLKARAKVQHLQDRGGELWAQLHLVCRCGLLVELRRGQGLGGGGLCGGRSAPRRSEPSRVARGD